MPVRQAGLSNDMFEFVRREATSYESVGAYTNPNFNVTGYDQAERLKGEVISAGYFAPLGVSPSAAWAMKRACGLRGQ